MIPWEGVGIRPMRDFVRTALFNILSDVVMDARFLDLFAGTGSVGLEALSHGAVEAVFVDRQADACQIIRRNLIELDLLDRAKVIQADFAAGLDRLQQRGRRFDLVFVGPPYGKGLAPAALRKLAEGHLLVPEAIVVVEVYKKEELKTNYGGLGLIDSRTYGDNLLQFYLRNQGTN